MLSTHLCTPSVQLGASHVLHDRYKLLEELGSGAFSTVKKCDPSADPHLHTYVLLGASLDTQYGGRCVHKSTGIEYAIKIIDNGKLSTFPDYKPESLMREVEILQKVNRTTARRCDSAAASSPHYTARNESESQL